jgi:hypothetical protein
MKRLLLVFVFISGFKVGYAQKVAFFYDQNGNRVSREFKLPGQRIDNSILDTLAFAEQFGNAQLLIYPNPVLTEVTIKINSDYSSELKDVKVNVLSVTGINVGTAIFDNNQYRFNFSNLPTGVYLIVVTANGCKREIKIIKE